MSTDILYSNFILH